MKPYLAHLAQRVADAPDFLACALAAYAHSELLDDAGLAARLACPVEVLTSLRLCRMPREEAPLFGQDVDRIAERFSLEADLLAEVVRRGQGLIRMRAGSDEQKQGPGIVLAARDDVREPEPPEGEKQ